MRNLKKILALVLALAMSLSLVTIASGIDLGDAEDIDHTEAVEVLTTLGVIQGYEDGNYYPDRVVKRSEMAKMITYILTGGKEPVLDSSNVSFGDTKGHWAAGYIEYCAAQGILNGYEDGNFYPERTVTASEAAKMILVTMNYDSKVFGFTGAGWAVNVAVEANKAGLYDELLGTNPSDGLDRDATAQMLYNGLTQMTMRLQYNHNIETGEVTQSYSLTGPSLLEDKFDASIEIGVLTSLNGNSKGFVVQDLDNGTTTIVNGNTVSFHSNVTNSDYTEDLTDLLGEEVRVIVRNNTSKNAVLGVYATGTSQVAYTTWNAIKADTTDSTEIAFGGKSYDIERPSATAAATPDQMLVNGSVSTASHFTNEKWNDVVKLVDIDGNGKYDIAYVTEIQMAQVTYVGKDNISVKYLDGNTGRSLSGLSKTMKLEDVTVYDGIAKDDYVAIYESAFTGEWTYVEVAVATGTISGTKEVDGEKQYLIDGTWYEAAKGVNVSMTAGDTVDYVADAGLLYSVEITSGAAGLDSLAMVITADIVNDYGVSGTALGSQVLKAKLLFADGSTKVVTISQIDKNGTVTDDTLSGSPNPAPTALETAVVAEIGELVAFTINADGEYELSTIAKGAAGSALPINGFDGSGDEETYNNEAIGGYELADDAVIFVLTKGNKNTAAATNEGKVYTGKEFKTTFGNRDKGPAPGDATFADADNAASLYVTENGFKLVKAAVVVGDPGITKGANYGYLVADSYESRENGKIYRNYSIFNGEDTITVKQENGTPVAAGVVISYDVVSDTEVKNVAVADVITDAVTGWDGESKIAFDQLAGSQKITQDTVIIYVDSANKAASEGSISLAEEPTSGNYVNNVRHIVDASGNVLFLLVDTNNDMAVNPATFQGTISNQADLQNALNAGWGVVKVTNDVGTATATVGEGQTLKVSATLTNKLTVRLADGATLDMSQLPDSVVSGKLEVTVNPGATLVYDNGTLIGEGGYMDSTAAINVKNVNDGTLNVTAVSGTITLKKDLVIGAGDTINVTGATVVAADTGISIEVRNETKLNGLDGKVYNSAADAIADSLENGTYTWTTFTVSGTDTVITGWLKTA